MAPREGVSSEIQEIAEGLRREPYSLLTNDCITKSVRFALACCRRGTPAKVVLCVGLAEAQLPLLRHRVTVPVIHAWAKVGGERIELSRPLGSTGVMDIVPGDIRPLISIEFCPSRAARPLHRPAGA